MMDCNNLDTSENWKLPNGPSKMLEQEMINY